MRFFSLYMDEDRLLAGRLAASAYLTVIVAGPLMPTLPGGSRAHWQLIIVLSAICAASGLAALVLIDWERTSSLTVHGLVLLALPTNTAMMLVSGGGASPARYYLLFLVVYAAYFFPVASPYLAAALVAFASPLLYQAGAVSEGYLTEVLVCVPAMTAVWALVRSGKRQLLELRMHERELARTDPLTGVLNRRAFEEEAARAMSRGARAATPVSLLALDIDEFKAINDARGHAGGDNAIEAVSKIITAHCRAGDIAARLGGDEFVVLLPGLGTADCADAAERLRQAVEQHAPFAVTISVGAATDNSASSDWSTLLDSADRRLYEAKARGRNCVAVGRTSDSAAGSGHRWSADAIEAIRAAG